MIMLHIYFKQINFIRYLFYLNTNFRKKTTQKKIIMEEFETYPLTVMSEYMKWFNPLKMHIRFRDK